VAVMDHPNILIAVVVLLVFTVAAEHDRRTGVYAGLAGIGGLLVVVVIQNPPDQLARPLLAAGARPALAGAAGELLRGRRGKGGRAERRRAVKRKRAGVWPRSDFTLLASSTTWSPTAWRSSTCRPAWRG